MGASSEGERRVRLSIDVDPELKRRLKVAAARKDLSIRDYLEVLLRHALEVEEMGGPGVARQIPYQAPVRSLERQIRSDGDPRYWET